MRESLDVWYQRELDFFRASCDEFAERFPKIAARLSLGTSGISDPHIERLIQAFAFLNARTRLKLEDSFPEIVDGMLGVLYPHMLRPVPSTGLVGMSLDRGQKEQFAGHVVPAGTSLETERVQGTACRFRTCYPVVLYPMDVKSAELLPRPFSGPRSPRGATAAAVLRIQLATYDPRTTFAKYGFESVRFYLNISNFEKAGKLLELIFSQTLEVVISGTDHNTAAAVLPASSLQPVGFRPEEQLLPKCARSFPGYELLSEYFVLPQKFLFFDVTGLTPEILSRLGNTLEISILLSEHNAELEDSVSRETVRTGCTPAVNLMTRTADAVLLNRRTSEYRVIPDARAEGTLEIYSVDRVSMTEEGNQTRDFIPLYSVQHGTSESSAGYWHSVRRPGATEGDSALFRSPSEMYMTLLDPDFSPRTSVRGTLFADVTCFNRNLPELLSHRRDAVPAKFAFAGAAGPVSGLECLVAPTPVLRNHMGRTHLWPLVSQLSLNHLSLCGEDGVQALREILRLNDPKDSVQTNNLIDGIQSVSAVSCVQRIDTAFVRGTEIRILLEDENFTGDSGYLFAAVLNQFLSMYTTINSFTRLSATTTRRKSRGLNPWTWTARTGNRPLI
ncbi:MAG: type VI secretion system baseplate subunit TssF [Planctomyces sp.]|nr:type VI secretion system baseplate subunit TssF [Planctomyces sp.]